MSRILVLGGSGFVGRHVCEKLARLQWHVTVPTRRTVNARHLLVHPMLTVVEGDVHDPLTLARLVAGHDAVVNLVAKLHGNEASFERAHVELPHKLAQACLATGVKRLVHISALGASSQQADTAPSMYLRSKGRGEAALQAAAAQGLQLSVLRPSVIFGAQDSFLNLFAKLQQVFPLMPLAGAEARFQPVWVEDVAQAVLTCLLNPRTAGQTYELCGPAVLTLRELVQLAGQLSGVRRGRGRPVLGLPMALARLQAWCMELAPGEPLMSRDNLDSMKVDNVASGKLPGLSALGIQPASLQAIAPTYLGPTVPGTELLAMRKTASSR
ncbi:MAG: complex I NDUFA9 subunit family protein [Gammaproteobacteria bacterium]|nr:complex I NDUFA9 subunit family protein [Gammaproteobacteria bacterium]MBU0786813.1 complex I NDUFA9 subunit family protein [Gammaproteobacteria bacterium]MBU0813981.1 complex I NDUFA9 subunit family protein [Gammaproteobacteria bacterium]MBU1788546.1 complex I NDUFA9 subunit family protein [Gammaproteobacteria bacterium]